MPSRPAGTQVDGLRVPCGIPDTSKAKGCLWLALIPVACQAPAVTTGIAGAQLASRGSFGATESGAVVQSNMEDLGLAQTENTGLIKLFMRDGPATLGAERL